MARAAAPSTPTAWVTRAAAPGNSEGLGPGAVVGDVPFPVGVGIIETEVEVSVAVEVLVASVVVAPALDAGVLDGAAVLLESGSETVTPLAAHVSLTLEMTSASSSGVQLSLTQGVTAAKRESAFWQWHLKSSRSAQPSEVKGPMKQFKAHLGTSGS